MHHLKKTIRFVLLFFLFQYFSLFTCFKVLIDVLNCISFFLKLQVPWFNIGSVDSFERNLENVQMEMNIEPPDFVPVVYKNIFELGQVTSFLPTLLIIGE